ncbi:MAG: hypothetical protein IKD53_12630 [Clostridia bacterium]|nr:hypothetical protein [Clostridia bacterium]
MKNIWKILALLLIAAVSLFGLAALAEGAEAPEDLEINCLIEEGSFIIQIPVAEGDEGWVADDMSQDDSVVKLYDADILEDTFVVRYDPVADGDMTVCVRHMNAIACDRALTWDLRVRDGAVQEVLGGSNAESPAESEQDPYIAGEWLVNDEIMAGMTIAKNEGLGWALEIRTTGPEGAQVLRANMAYDCELDAFVYSDGALYASEGTDSSEGEMGDALSTEVSGTLRMLDDGNGGIDLEWYNALKPDETAVFYRPQG